jgi:hypothetical protein
MREPGEHAEQGAKEVRARGHRTRVIKLGMYREHAVE